MKLAHKLAHKPALVLIGMPMLLATLYYACFAADRYVSESVIAVRQAQKEPGDASAGAALLLAGASPPSREDTLYVQTYVHSLDLLGRLDRQLGLRAHFESERMDPVYRLYRHTSQEWLRDYFRDRVDVQFNDASSLLTLRVEAFDPAYAQRLNETILHESERFVNAYSQRIAQEQMRFAESELERSARKLQVAQAGLLAFQSTHRLLDPTSQAQAADALTAQLQASLARQEAELKNALSYMNEDAYAVKALRNQVQALRAQIVAEESRATGGRGAGRLNALAADFHSLTTQARFAEDAYKLALAAVENARIDATRKQKSLIVIEPPSRPQSAAYPRRLYNLVTLLVACSLLYAIGRMTAAAIREHMD